MKIITCEQYSPEWYAARLGIPTASALHKIITPAEFKPSKQSGDYMAELLSEWWMGHPVDTLSTAPMQRGSDLEAEAVAAFEFQFGLKTEPVGFMLNDEGTFGASPDRLVEDGSLLEVKCSLPKNHMNALLSQKPEQDRMPQLLGQLYVSGAKLNRLWFYHPELPYVHIPVERDEANEAKIGLLQTALEKFWAEMLVKRSDLEREYRVPAPNPIQGDTNNG